MGERPKAALYGLNAYLLFLLLAVLVPIMGSAAIAVWTAGTAHYDSASSRLVETARAFARVVDAEFEHRSTYVLALGANHALLQRADLKDLDALFPAVERLGRLAFLSNDPAREVSAYDRKTAALLGSAMERANRERKAVVSNLFFEVDTGLPKVAIVVPCDAFGAGDAIAMIASPESLIPPLRSVSLDGTVLLMTVIDGEGMVVARSRDSEKWVGKPVPTWDRQAIANRPEGLIEANALDGGRLMVGFKGLSLADGWQVVAAEPTATFEARWYQPIKTLGIGLACAAVIAFLAAWRIARLVLRPVRSLARRAEAIASGMPPAPAIGIPPSAIAEFERLRQSLETSEATLQNKARLEREAAIKLSKSERRYRALVHAGALIFWRCDKRWRLIEAKGWGELVGEAESEILGTNWLRYVFEEDQRLIVAAGTKAAAGAHGVIDVEFRLRMSDADIRWVRARGVLIEADEPGPAEWIGVLEDIDARRKAQARIAHMAQHDALTGLGNRALLREALEAVIADPRQRADNAVLYIDLDRFKTVNDTLGHSAGDALLRAVGERLRGFVTGQDVAARLGGDEFALVVHDFETIGVLTDIAHRVVAALAEPFLVAGNSLTIGASVGIAIIERDGSDVDTILRNADLALYRAKDEGRGRYRLFEPAMADKAQERHELERDLRGAIAQGQFLVHFQPVIALATGGIAGFEALLRWQHPERGMLSPATFIPIAEETGMIEEIGTWVLREATREAAGWPEPLKVAVNVSPYQLLRRDFADTVIAALEASGLPGTRLELEITETVLVQNTESAMAALLRLKFLGCSIAMDDFGTGYSSLSFLRAFSFDKVKIDRSFVKDLEHDPESRAIVASILDLCGALGIRNTAEGVETEAQAAFLKARGCALAQGYLYGHPAPAGKLREAFSVLGGGGARHLEGVAWHRGVG